MIYTVEVVRQRFSTLLLFNVYIIYIFIVHIKERNGSNSMVTQATVWAWKGARTSLASWSKRGYRGYRGYRRRWWGCCWNRYRDRGQLVEHSCLEQEQEQEQEQLVYSSSPTHRVLPHERGLCFVLQMLPRRPALIPFSRRFARWQGICAHGHIPWPTPYDPVMPPGGWIIWDKNVRKR